MVAKVQKILPPGVKFGRGWVGEEEKPSGGQPKPPEPVVPLTATAAKTGPGSLSAAGAKPEALLRPGSAGAKSGTGASPASLSKTGPPAAVASPFTPASSIGPQQAMGISPVGGRTSLAIAPPEGEDHDAEDKPIGLVFGGPQRGASPTPYGRPPSASGFRPSSAGRKETAGLETGSRDGAGTVPETRMAEAGAKKESKAFERDGTEMATSAGAQPGGITSAGAQSEAVTSEGGQPGHATSAAGAPVKSQTAEEKRQPAVQDSAVAGSAPLEAPVHAFAKVDDVSSAGAASAGTEQAASVPEDGSKLSEKALDAEGRSGSDSVLPFLTPADFRGPAQGGGAAAAENLWRQRTGEAGTGVGETDFLRTEEAGPSSREEEERSREPVSFRDEGAETLSKEQMPIKRPEGGPERANIVPIGEGMQTPTEELPSARLSEPGPSSGVHGLEVPPEKQSGTSTGQHGLKFRPGKESEPSPEVHGLEVRSATESTPVPGESEEPPSVEGAPPVENQELIEDEKETAAGVFEDHQDGGARVGAPGAPSAGAEAKGESVGGLSENLRNGGPPEGALRGPRAKSDDEEGEVDGALAGERKEDRGLVARRGVSSEGLQEAGGLAGAETGTEQPVDTKKDADTEQLVETEKAVEWEIPAEPATPAKPETPAETENSAGLSEPARDAGARGGVRVAPADLRGGGELEAQEPDAPETVAAQGELTAAEGDAVVGARVGESETAEKASSEAERGPRTKTAPQETAALEEGGEGGSEEEPSEPSERHPSAADGPESAQTDAAMHQRDSPPVPEPNVPEAAPLVSETVTLTLPLPLTSDRDALLAEDVPSTPTGLPLGSPSFASRAKSPSPCLSPGSSRALSVERGVSVDPLAGFGSPLSVQSYSPGRLGAVYRGSSLAPAGRRTDSDGRERSSSIDTRDDMASHSGR